MCLPEIQILSACWLLTPYSPRELRRVRRSAAIARRPAVVAGEKPECSYRRNRVRISRYTGQFVRLDGSAGRTRRRKYTKNVSSA
jgi:hypothetical protein